ncbi:uncharacterized protein LOC131226769 isoform X2 [Magnolia sinica]|uniref:uncharacterized protein LOC131226769 isoform X2 n=1 Tax=Magnolia sinica TaxID=86752 RepID=UPI0026592A5A|nr:uncharacterized protein LOC131226769 isoform X2 [Magnolia sinica]
MGACEMQFLFVQSQVLGGPPKSRCSCDFGISLWPCYTFLLSSIFMVLGRVRVAVRLRPRNAEELVADADFADCVELQPESSEEGI